MCFSLIQASSLIVPSWACKQSLVIKSSSCIFSAVPKKLQDRFNEQKKAMGTRQKTDVGVLTICRPRFVCSLFSPLEVSSMKSEEKKFPLHSYFINTSKEIPSFCTRRLSQCKLYKTNCYINGISM